MDREAGIEAYQAMITAEEYQARLQAGDESAVHRYTADGESPVMQVGITRARITADGVSIYEFKPPGGGIGVTPMIAMAHELHAQERDFVLHYSGRSMNTMGYLDDIAAFP